MPNVHSIAGTIAVVLALATGAIGSGNAQAALPGEAGRIYFDRGGDIWSVNPDGSNLVRLTSTGGSNPTASADGALIAFETPEYEIATMSWNGTNQQVVATPAAGHRYEQPSFGADGTIVFAHLAPGGSYSVDAIEADGTGQIQLSTIGEVVDPEPKLGPAGDVAAYLKGGPPPDEDWAKHLISEELADGSTTDRTPDGMGVRDFDFTPDGDFLALAATGQLGAYEAIEIDSSTGDVTDGPAIPGDPVAIAASPDGAGQITSYVPESQSTPILRFAYGGESWDLFAGDNPVWAPARGDEPNTTLVSGPDPGVPVAGFVRFDLGSTTAGSTFECKTVPADVIGASDPWKACANPYVVNLDDGSWKVWIRAVTSGGVPDPMPILRTITVDWPGPNTTIKRDEQSLLIESDLDDARFECRFPSSSVFQGCDPRVPLWWFSEGSHVLQARARSADGSAVDPRPASIEFEVPEWTTISAASPRIPSASGTLLMPSPSFRFRSPIGHKRFQFRLDGSDWHGASGNRAHISGPLRPGPHVLEARSISESGVRDHAPAVLRFRVPKPTPIRVKVVRWLPPSSLAELANGRAGAVVQLPKLSGVRVTIWTSREVTRYLGLNSPLLGKARRTTASPRQVTVRVELDEFAREVVGGGSVPPGMKFPYRIGVRGLSYAKKSSNELDSAGHPTRWLSVGPEMPKGPKVRALR